MRKKFLMIIGAIVSIFLMLSAATAVPNVKIKKTIETSELNNNFREKITEQIEDIPINIKTDQRSIF